MHPRYREGSRVYPCIPGIKYIPICSYSGSQPSTCINQEETLYAEIQILSAELQCLKRRVEYDRLESSRRFEALEERIKYLEQENEELRNKGISYTPDLASSTDSSSLSARVRSKEKHYLTTPSSITQEVQSLYASSISFNVPNEQRQSECLDLENTNLEEECTQASTEVSEEMNSIQPQSGELHIIGGFNGHKKLNETVERYAKHCCLWDSICEIPVDIKCIHASAVNLDEQQVFILSSYPSIYSNFILGFNQGCLEGWTVVSTQRKDPSCLAASVKLNNKICCVGGYKFANQARWTPSLVPFPSAFSDITLTTAVELYDPHRDDWELLKPLITPKLKPALVQAEESVIYSIGGLVWSTPNALHPSSTIERFDIREGTWKELGNMCHPRAFFGAVGSEYYLTCMGGITTALSNDGCLATEAQKSVEQCDLRMDRWLSMEPLSIPRCCFTSHIFDGTEIYIIGGQSELSLNQKEPLNILDMERYSLGHHQSESNLLAGKEITRTAHASFAL